MDLQSKTDFYELQQKPTETHFDEKLRQTDASGVATGTREDALDMQRLGRTQELRRNFKSFAILGMAAVTMATWIAVLQAAIFGLINGGTAGMIWVYLATWIITIALVMSLAEMASMSPTSGGQYRKPGRPAWQLFTGWSLTSYARMGFGAGPSQPAAISQLCCRLAVRAGLAGCDRGSVLYQRYDHPSAGGTQQRRVCVPTLARHSSHDRGRRVRNFRKHLRFEKVAAVGGNHTVSPYLRILCDHHSSASTNIAKIGSARLTWL